MVRRLGVEPPSEVMREASSVRRGEVGTVLENSAASAGWGSLR